MGGSSEGVVQPDGSGGGKLNGALTFYPSAIIGSGGNRNALVFGNGNVRLLWSDYGEPLWVGATFRVSTGAVSFEGATQFISYKGIATAGPGVPAIYGGGTIDHETNHAPASVAYTPPTTAGRYRISGSLLVKTATTLSLKLGVTYTGADGVSHTDAVVFTKEGSPTLLTAVVAADRYNFEWDIVIDASGGAITLADNSGTYTTCEYWLAPTIEQLS